MLFFYSLGVRLYGLLVFFASPFNVKARQLLQGRKTVFGNISAQADRLKGGFWFHFPSLGEFEQGRPVLEALKRESPEKKVVITFFSPSGYIVRKNYAGADAVFYLPQDNAANAARFLDLLQPELALFTKYDYWYFFFRELHTRGIPLYVISAIFRRDQPFFKWYGDVHREMLGFISRLFVQDAGSKELLATLAAIPVDQIIVAGDTRFDRVAENARIAKRYPEIERFIGNAPVFLCGSTWAEDEELLSDLPGLYPDWKWIIAPHEIGASRIDGVLERFKAFNPQKLSAPVAIEGSDSSRVMVIDSIGHLSALYRYGNLAYIGGGFGVGIHNTLEPASFDLPVVFGPNYTRFKEARDLVSIGGGFSIGDSKSLQQVFANLVNETTRNIAGKLAGDYVRANTGATDLILSEIGSVNL